MALISKRMCCLPNTNELNIREVFTEEIIHWCFYPLHTQAPISLPNQNQTLKLVPLWVIQVSIVDRLARVDLF